MQQIIRQSESVERRLDEMGDGRLADLAQQQ